MLGIREGEKGEMGVINRLITNVKLFGSVLLIISFYIIHCKKKNHGPGLKGDGWGVETIKMMLIFLMKFYLLKLF